MQTGLLHLHSFLRWVVILLALITIVNSLRGMLMKKHFHRSHQRVSLFLLISCDLQLLLGITIYFVNGWWNAITGEGVDVMSDPMKRFFTVEHTIGMIIGITLIHIGYASAKKALHSEPKFKRLFWYTLSAMIVILASVPWPFRQALGPHTWFPGMH